MTKEQWQAIRHCDAAFDGQFYYALRPAKKVCRPSCRKRRCDPRRVVIFPSLDEALARGYQPCNRCRPGQADWAGAKAELARSAERYIRGHYREKFSLDLLAQALHINKSYLARTFREQTGGTLLEFHNRVRCEAARELLTSPELTIGYISSAVGYASPSHFTQVFQKYFHCTPSACRAAYLESLDE